MHYRQLFGVLLILVGAALATADATQLAFAQSWLGDLLFFVAALFFSCYLIVNRLWQIRTTQILLCGSVINAVIYLPVWFVFLPSGFADASQFQLVLQAFYQGLVPNLIGLLLVAFAVRHIGAAPVAAVMAGVPGIATLLSVLILGEVPGLLGWLSLALLTPGIIMVALVRSESPA